ncbi:hypothetical protein Fmac_000254 [Flemingia macrophylla]|uniref:DM8 domain-containing protein n=1 Tax=Flemingia macrophylla TaxID=520843 RepID=A0ABD1NDR5_9FABA
MAVHVREHGALAASGDICVAKAVREMAWEQLHSKSWHSVLPVWRDGYSMACLHVARLHYTNDNFREINLAFVVWQRRVRWQKLHLRPGGDVAGGSPGGAAGTSPATVVVHELRQLNLAPKVITGVVGGNAGLVVAGGFDGARRLGRRLLDVSGGACGRKREGTTDNPFEAFTEELLFAILDFLAAEPSAKKSFSLVSKWFYTVLH